MGRKIIIVLGITVLAVVGVIKVRDRYKTSSLPNIDKIFPAPSYRAARPYFPYSVIPGGVLNPSELNASIQHDAVVRDHYAGLNPNRMVPARMPKATMAYVSYRIGDKVRWTSKKVMIPAGELVLSDGVNYVRGRCGNRVSFYPAPEATAEKHREPVPPIEDPPVEVMEAGMPGLMKAALPPPPLQPSLVPTAPAVPTTPPTPPLVPPGVYWPPVVPPPVWCCSTRPEPPPPPPPGAVPEPSTILLLSTGVGVLVSRFKR